MTSAAGRAGSARSFVLAALVCAAALGGTYGVFVRTTAGQFADESAWREAGLLAPQTKGLLLRLLDLLPALSLVLAAAGIVFVALVRRRYAAAIVAGLVIVASNLTTQVLKNVVLDRPDRGVDTLGFNSLPSGHTTLAASAAAAVLLIVTPSRRPLTAAAGAVYAVLAGSATLVNLWHRPADVVAALLVVGCWGLLGGAVIPRTDDPADARPPPAGGSPRHRWIVSYRAVSYRAMSYWIVVCWIVGVGTLILAALLCLALQTGILSSAPDAGRPLFLWWGLLWIAGTGSVLAATTASLLAARTRPVRAVPVPR